MPLAHEHYPALHDALLTAFPKPDALRLLVRAALGVPLEIITSTNSTMPGIVLDILEYADAHDLIVDVIKTARKLNSKNLKLRDTEFTLLPILLGENGKTLPEDANKNALPPVDQLIQAQTLLDYNYTRAAGVLAGVILEQHLINLYLHHIDTPLHRPVLVIFRLNDELYHAGVYDTAQWGKVKEMNAVRNICSHATPTEPDTISVGGLVAAVRQLIRLFPTPTSPT